MWGEQIFASLQFASGRFAPELALYDSVRGDTVVASEMFETFEDEKPGLWILCPESMPFDEDLKALAVTDRKIMLETAPIDRDQLSEIASECKVRWRTFGRGIHFYSGPRKLIEISPTVKVTSEIESRVLWTIEWTRLSMDLRKLAILVADTIYNNSWFTNDGVHHHVSSGVASGFPAMELKQNLAMQQTMKLEQRPILSVSMSGQLVQDQRLELRQFLALQHTILHMNEEQLLAFVAKDTSPAGQRRSLRTIVSALAYKVRSGDIAKKKAQGRIDFMNWHQARKAAWKLVS